MVTPRRFDVWLCDFDPTRGNEINSQRPAVIVSPDVYNASISWFTVAPMTTGSFSYSVRVPTVFGGTAGVIAVDQLRCVSRLRLVKRKGEIDAPTSAKLLEALAAFFAP